MRKPPKPLWARRLLLSAACLIATPAAADPKPAVVAAPDAHATPGSQTPGEPLGYLPETQGRLLVWLEPAGVAWWATTRSPLGDLAPVVTGLGFARESGPARLAWRLHFAHEGPADGPVRFVMVDFLSFERVYRPGAALRPWWRLAMGFGLDLKGAQVDLGGSGYFNAANGASGGLMLGHGWGLDAWLSDRWFVRIEGNARAHVGAGRNGLILGGAAGVGFAWDLPAPPTGPAGEADR